MRIIVGDDDDPNDAGTTDGNSEHLSFVGPTIVEQAELPDLSLTKTGSSVAMSGDLVSYTLTIDNLGPGAATGVVVTESYPTGFTYMSASPVPTSGDATRDIGGFGSGAQYTIAITGSISGLTGSYTNTARVSADFENDIVTNTGTHTTDIVCAINYNTECTGTANICGATMTGTVQCDGSCSADTPADPVDLGVSCTLGQGVCAATGMMVCDETGTGVVCDAIAGIPGEIDTCDGLDNDCDGIVDEDFATTATSCGVGACQASGTTACILGIVVDSCAAGEAGIDNICNGIDDDCDGEIDEDFVIVQTSCGQGVCVNTGINACVDGEVVDSCLAGDPATDDTICDGLDNDCDGEIDEDFVIVATQCGEGACASIGNNTCVAGTIVDSCVDGSPGMETCDELDNDCDGLIDEENVCVEPPVTPDTASIFGTIFFDDEDDDVYIDDTGLPGIQVNLVDDGGSIVASTTTYSNGEYSFVDVIVAKYTVEYTNTTGFTTDSDVDGDSATSITITNLALDNDSVDNNFGLILASNRNAGGRNQSAAQGFVTTSSEPLPTATNTPIDLEPTAKQIVEINTMEKVVLQKKEQIEVIEIEVDYMVNGSAKNRLFSQSTLSPITLPNMLPQTGSMGGL